MLKNIISTTVANEVSRSDFVEMLIGDGVKCIRKLIDEARFTMLGYQF